MVCARPERSRLTLELRIIPRISEVSAAVWDALLPEDASPFVEHTWLACLEEAQCVGPKSGWHPQHLVLYDGAEVVAAAPAYVKTNSDGEFVFDWSWADLASRMGLLYYPKLVCAVPFTPATSPKVLVKPGLDRRAIVGAFAGAMAEVAKELPLSSAHVLFPNEDEAKLFADAGMMVRHGVQYHWHNRGFSTFEDFLSTLPSKKRTQIRRERKQPSIDGITVETLRAQEYSPQIARAMHTLYLTTVDKYFYGRRYMTGMFFELVAARFAERLAWVVARRTSDGEIVAGAFNVKRGKVLYGRYWGAHVDLPFLHFNVCYYHGIDQAIREGLSTFNPGAGGEHKRIRGFVPTKTFSAHHIVDPRFRAIVDAHLARERRAIDDYVACGGKDDEPG